MDNVQDYETVAAKIGEDFVNGGGECSINTLATKVAEERCYNPEEIKTVVRLANVVAFEKTFEKRATEKSPDRMIEFTVGDPEVVISNLHKEAAKIHSEAAPDAYDAAQDIYSDIKKVAETIPLEKTASDTTLRKEPCYSQRAVHSLFKKAEARMQSDSLQQQQRWFMGLEKAAQSMRVVLRNENERNTFEKDAVSILGDGCLNELGVLRTMTKLSFPEEGGMGHVKKASVERTHVENASKDAKVIITFIKEAADARKEYQESIRGAKWIAAKLAEVN
jgi:hypothetical protein